MVLRLILGDDPVLVGEAVTTTVDELVGDGDRSLMLETLTEADYRTDEGLFESAKLLDAARTPPFLTDKRVVVGRHASRFSRKDDYGPIVALLGEDLATTDLVLVWERGIEPKVDKMPPVPKALKEAVEIAGGGVVQTSPPRGKGAAGWLREQLGTSSLDFDGAAVAAIEDLIGEDRGRVVGIVRTLEGALGEGARVSAEDVATYGGDELGEPSRGRSTTRSTRATLPGRSRCCNGSSPPVAQRLTATGPHSGSWRSCIVATPTCCASTGPAWPATRRPPRSWA